MILRGFAEQCLYVFDKSEAQHLVRLIEHDFVDLGKVNRTAAQMIEQASRRPDDELRMTAQFFLLTLDILTAVNDES